VSIVQRQRLYEVRSIALPFACTLAFLSLSDLDLAKRSVWTTRTVHMARWSRSESARSSLSLLLHV